MTRILIALLILSCFGTAAKLEAVEIEQGKIIGKFLIGPTKTLFSDSKANTTFGISAEGFINEKNCIEITLLFLDIDYYSRTNGIKETIRRADIHMGYRYILNPIFTLGISLGTAYSFGDIESSKVDKKKVITSASKTAEYTLVASSNITLLKLEKVNIGLIPLYSFPISPENNEVADRVSLLLSFSFNVQ